MDNLTGFEREGFFEVSSLGVFTHVNKTYGEFLDIFYRLNKLAWPLQYELPKARPSDKESTRRAFCLILYSRTLNFIQAAVMLSTRGMRVQANTQHRCALETLFKLGALTNDEQFIVEYDLAERKDHIRLGRALLSNLNRISNKTETEKTQIKEIKLANKHKEREFIARLKKHRPELFINRSEREAFKKFSLTTEECARRAGRLEVYDVHYRRTSASIHSDARSLEDGHFDIDEKGNVSAFKNEPNIEDLHMYITSYCITVIDAARFVIKALGHEYPKKELSSIEKSLEACLETMNSAPR